MHARHPLPSVVTVFAAMFMGGLEVTVVVTALPTLAAAFPHEGSWVPWVLTASLMGAAVALPLAGKLADDWGPKPIFVSGVALFTTASLGSALVGTILPGNMALLVALRFLQGLGGGGFAPIAIKLMAAAYRGGSRVQLMGLGAMVSPAAALLGPNLGGFVIDHWPWQTVFWISVPLGVLVVLAGLLVLPAPVSVRHFSFDWYGCGLLSVTTLLLIVGFTQVRESGWDSPSVMTTLSASVALALTLAYNEIHSQQPLVDPSLLRRPDLVAVLVMSFVQGVLLYSTLYFLSFYAQSHPDIQASGSQVGGLLTPAALAQLTFAPLVGRAAARLGYRWPLGIGVLLSTTAALLMLARPTSMLLLGILLIMSRAGSTTASIPLAASGLGTGGERAGSITGLRQLSHALGGVVGPVGLSILLPADMPAEPSDFASVFVVLGILVLATLPLVLLVGPRKVSPRLALE